ncbi:unnamed protein product [Rhizophagus irregularis]|nr:unnamed protein product [Rhizophagus irregularis]
MGDSKCRYGICECQRYKAQAGKDVCLFCSHSIGFHEIPFSNINIEEHPYGQCQECRYCQIYKEGTPDKNFRNVGRPVSDSVTINHLVFLDKESSNKIPKKGTDLWNIMMNKGHIKENVSISKADNILDKVRNLYGINDQRVKLKLYSPKGGKPIEINDELSFDLIKSSITKANRRLYIGPDINSSINLNFSSSSNTDNLVNGGTSSEEYLEIIENLPPQLLNNNSFENTYTFFNGTYF